MTKEEFRNELYKNKQGVWCLHCAIDAVQSNRWRSKVLKYISGDCNDRLKFKSMRRYDMLANTFKLFYPELIPRLTSIYDGDDFIGYLEEVIYPMSYEELGL